MLWIGSTIFFLLVAGTPIAQPKEAVKTPMAGVFIHPCSTTPLRADATFLATFAARALRESWNKAFKTDWIESIQGEGTCLRAEFQSVAERLMSVHALDLLILGMVHPRHLIVDGRRQVGGFRIGLWRRTSEKEYREVLDLDGSLDFFPMQRESLLGSALQQWLEGPIANEKILKGLRR